jgi:sugar phosphate isomerase/epimerase
MHDIIDGTGAENIGICVDTGHANLHPPAAHHIRAAGDKLIALQIDDSSDHANQHILPGRGTTGWPALMQALAEVRYTGNFVYELMDPADIPHLAENYRWLFAMLPQAAAPA